MALASQAVMTEGVDSCGQGGGEAFAEAASVVVAAQMVAVPADVDPETVSGREDGGEVAASASAARAVIVPDIVDGPAYVDKRVVNTSGEEDDGEATAAASVAQAIMVAGRVLVSAGLNREADSGGGGSEEAAVVASVGQAVMAQEEKSDVEDSGRVAAAPSAVGPGRRTRSGGRWKRLVASAGGLVLTIMLGVVGASLFQR